MPIICITIRESMDYAINRLSGLFQQYTAISMWGNIQRTGQWGQLHLWATRLVSDSVRGHKCPPYLLPDCRDKTLATPGTENQRIRAGKNNCQRDLNFPGTAICTHIWKEPAPPGTICLDMESAFNNNVGRNRRNSCHAYNFDVLWHPYPNVFL